MTVQLSGVTLIAFTKQNFFSMAKRISSIHRLGMIIIFMGEIWYFNSSNNFSFQKIFEILKQNRFLQKNKIGLSLQENKGPKIATVPSTFFRNSAITNLLRKKYLAAIFHFMHFWKCQSILEFPYRWRLNQIFNWLLCQKRTQIT